MPEALRTALDCWRRAAQHPRRNRQYAENHHAGVAQLQRQPRQRDARLQTGFDQPLFAGRIIATPAISRHAERLKLQRFIWSDHRWCPPRSWWTPHPIPALNCIGAKKIALTI